MSKITLWRWLYPEPSQWYWCADPYNAEILHERVAADHAIEVQEFENEVSGKMFAAILNSVKEGNV